ncbi:katanin P80 subunit [Penicillium soppii]|uniref:katanin P80 subunit n=1 Tax=Penicillium soppii TaxID=69789 RepID=UPI0025484D07|nr:katanin P80 subunit [Penicillium soppii]KAJ5876229.1 katanin P80 subunit [Penicillium soppii]
MLALASNDNTVKIWDVSNGQCVRTLEGYSYSRYSDSWTVTFSHDLKMLASELNDKTVKIWNISNGQCLQTLMGHSRPVTSIVFSRDSTLLALVLSNSSVKVWDKRNGNCLQTFEAYSSPAISVISVIFSHDSRLLAAGLGDNLANKTFKVWDINHSQCPQTLKGHSRSVTSVVFSHDSKVLASASDDKTIKTWDTSNGKCLQTLKSHRSSITSVIFSHDSKLLASASNDKTVKVWDTSNAQCLQTLSFEIVVSVKSLDATKSVLEIDLGTIHLSLDSSQGPTKPEPKILRFQGYGVSPDCTWITWNSQNMLWLPPVYRPSAVAVGPSTISIGCDSGRVLIFNFDSQRLLHSLIRA